MLDGRSKSLQICAFVFVFLSTRVMRFLLDAIFEDVKRLSVLESTTWIEDERSNHCNNQTLTDWQLYQWSARPIPSHTACYVVVGWARPCAYCGWWGRVVTKRGILLRRAYWLLFLRLSLGLVCREWEVCASLSLSTQAMRWVTQWSSLLARNLRHSWVRHAWSLSFATQWLRKGP